MLLFDKLKGQLWEVLDIPEYKVDIVTNEPIEILLKGEFDTTYGLGLRGDSVEEFRFFTLEAYPFGQQLCRPIMKSIEYDAISDTTKLKLNLNSLAFKGWSYTVWDTRSIYPVVNAVWRRSFIPFWSNDNQWGSLTSALVIGKEDEGGYVDLTDYTNLCIPVSEVYRQLILNQQFKEVPDPSTSRVNLVKREGLRKKVSVAEAIDFTEKDINVDLPTGYLIQEFVTDSTDEMYPVLAYYKVVFDGYEFSLEHSRYYGGTIYTENVERILVESATYDVQNDDPQLRVLAQAKLDEQAFENHIELMVDINSSIIDQMNLEIGFSHLGEVMDLYLDDNSVIYAKLTALKYDYEKQLFTLTFGTKRKFLTDIIRKEFRKNG